MPIYVCFAALIPLYRSFRSTQHLNLTITQPLLFVKTKCDETNCTEVWLKDATKDEDVMTASLLYRGLQGNPCNKNRDPVMRTGVPCKENRFFPVGIGSQGVLCELYRVWVCSVL